MYEIFEQLLQRSGLTAYKVAKDTGVTQTALSNWKTGKSVPNTQTLQKIADYFNVSIDYLLNGKDEDAPAYYLNNETAKIAQEIFENRGLHVLFDASRNLSPDDIQAVITMVNALNKKGSDSNDTDD